MAEIILSHEKLKEIIIGKFRRVNVEEEYAEIVADVLVHANLRNVNSHGAMRMEQYIERIQDGGLNIRPNITVEKTGPVTAMVNGDNGMGHIVSKKAMETAIELSKEKGIGVVGVTNSEHCGALSYFVQLAAENDVIGMAMTNSNKYVAPFGGKNPFFGTNPVAYGFPSGSHDPVILDMATSNVAFGKIVQARKNNQSIPADWGVDENGKPTTDPNDVSVLLPIAGPKGYGLGMVIDIFSGVLTGSPFAPDVLKYQETDQMRNLGHFFMAINPGFFIGTDQFKKNMDDLINRLYEQEPAHGFDRIMVPGEPEQLMQEKRLKEGIPLSQSLYDFLCE